ncbi:hypothetical protein ACE6H2_016266 [Prunus campanulata]
MSSSRIGRRKAGLRSKKRGDDPPLLNRISLVRTSFEVAVRSPGKSPRRNAPSSSPSRHPTTHSSQGSNLSSPPIANELGTGIPCLTLRTNPFTDFPCLHCCINQRLFTLET